MIMKRPMFGVLAALSFAAAAALSLPACAQDARRTEPSSRPVAERGQLTAVEQSVTALFEEATPSVVYITSVALRRDFFRFNVMEIPSGTGSGFVWDDRGNIGKRYYSQDEIGTPYCITVDFDTLNQNDITIRDRDTAEQKRVKISELVPTLKQKLGN